MKSIRAKGAGLATLKTAKTYKKHLQDADMISMKSKRYAVNSNRKVRWATGAHSNWRKACIETTRPEMCDTDILA